MPTKTIIVSFDMETDIGSWTNQERGIIEGTPEILRTLSHHQIKATFLFTGREALNHPHVVEHVLSEGHEIGCHTMFHETLGVAVYDVPGECPVLEGEIRGRLEMATDAIEKVAGARPVSFRAPKLFGSSEMINVLDDLGYVADSSFPAYFHARDFLPYHPSREDWSKDGDLRIVEMPVFYDTEAAAEDPTNRSRDQWPMLRLRGGRWFSELCRRMQEQVRDKHGDSVLCVYLHPWEFAHMHETIYTDEARITFKPFLHQNTGDFARHALEEFLELMQADGVQFTTMKDYALTFKG
jgi:peptidoglycan/xylan/chitin deacetylase (PgdA/CDA1 family)